MTTKWVLGFALLLLLSALAAPTPQTLVNGDPNRDAQRPQVAIAKNGDITVAYLEASGPNKALQMQVKRWRNGARGWQRLGGVLNQDPTGYAFDTTLDLDSQNRPVVAWVERSNISVGKLLGPGRLYTARYDAPNWTVWPSPSKMLNRSPDIPRMKLDPEGLPVVLWSEFPADINADSVFVARYDGTTWQDIDIGSLSSDISHSSRSRDLAVGKNGQAVVAYSLQPFVAGQPKDFNVFVGPWDGKHWSPLGGVSLNINSTRYAASASLALDAQDHPVVAWSEANSGFDVFAKRWNGKTWQRLGDTINGKTGLASYPKIALQQNGTPIVAYLENAGSLKVVVRRWDGQKWQPLGGFLNINPKSYADGISIDLDAQDNAVVTWSEEVTRTQRRVYVKRWDGKTWVGL